MKYSDIQIVLQEVPGEISICFSITGCSLRCDGCHSSQLWKKGLGQELTPQVFNDTLEMYKGFASCVLFMGGEWHESILFQYLQIARMAEYNTCLYSGEDYIDKSIMSQLTWLKTGRWVPEKGGLDCQKTNQKFVELKTKKLLNHLFKKHKV